MSTNGDGGRGRGWRAETRFVCSGIGTMLGDALAEHPNRRELVRALARGEQLLRVVLVDDRDLRFELVDPAGSDADLVKLTGIKRITRGAGGDIETIEEFAPLSNGATR